MRAIRHTVDLIAGWAMPQRLLSAFVLLVVLLQGFQFFLPQSSFPPASVSAAPAPLGFDVQIEPSGRVEPAQSRSAHFTLQHLAIGFLQDVASASGP